jgi:hypothetical protein
MEFDVSALQVLDEADPEIGLFPCAGTCTCTCVCPTA